MNTHELLTVCLLAFFWVFAVLAILAIIMRVMTIAFPQKDTTSDIPLYTAITAVIGQILPGTRVTKIEEVK